MRTVPYDRETMEYLLEIVQPYVWLKSHPVTEPIAADFLPLFDEWKAVLLKEIQLIQNVTEAEARVLLADFDLDALFNAIINALKTVVGNDMTAALMVRFLGNDPAHVARAPILGDQLERMRTWPPGLSSVPSGEAKAKGAELAAFVPKADLVVEAQRKAEQELVDFTDLGERRAFVDHLNAVRKLAFGKASNLMHTPEGASLPPDFSERCFPAEVRSRGPTIKGEERTIGRLKGQLARHEAILAKLMEKDATSKQAREDAERAALLDEAAALKKEGEEKLARAAEVEAKLGKKPS